jgi:hypothetical protein
MSDAVPGPMSSGSMNDATNAFQAAIDAETPSRSRSQPRTEKDPDDDPRMGIDDLFPQRAMNRDEDEGGEHEPPPRVQQDEDEPEDEEPGPREEDEESEDDDDDVDEQPDDEGAEQAAAGPLDLNQVIQTTIDGEVVELPLGEAIRSGMRERTFHKYLSSLDLAVRETNTQRQNLSDHYTEHLAKVQEFEAWMNELLPEPDWPTLFRTNPTQAMQARVEWDAIMQKREGVRAYIGQIRQREAAENNRQLHNFANANRSQMMAAHKEWSNEKTFRRDHDSMRRTAKSVGYTDQEVDALYDARAIEILLKASKYDRLMAAKPKPVKQGFTPGKRNGATPSRNVSRALDRAERRISRGTAKDTLAATFERMLNSEG